MNSYTTETILRALNNEVLRRLLIQYFTNKGFDTSFKARIYPGDVMDIVQAIPELEGKIEVVPSAEEVDPKTGYAKIRWDMYVLGNQRLFLGFTEHANINEFLVALRSASNTLEKHSSYETTPFDIIRFITRILHNDEAGMIKTVTPTNSIVKYAMSQFHAYHRPGPARYET